MASLKWTNFVSAACLDDSFPKNDHHYQHLQQKLDGNEIQKFYEDVTSTPCTSSSSESFRTQTLTASVSKRKRVPRSNNSPTFGNRGILNSHPRDFKFSLNNFFKAAQENSVTDLKVCLQSGCNVDAQDEFGWTALMCAVCSGSMECIELLLNAGANLNLKDKNGRSVWNIARRQSNKSLLDLLRQGGSCSKQSSSATLESSQEEVFYCESCKITVCQTSHNRHATSTVHLLNCERKKPPTVYFLPENNVGFRLMVKAGWNKDVGLGPEGMGLKYPVKTVLKRDRKGIGSETNNKARITHFKPCDISAITDLRRRKGSMKRMTKLYKKQMSQKQTKEKQKEIEFRRMFH